MIVVSGCARDQHGRSLDSSKKVWMHVIISHLCISGRVFPTSLIRFPSVINLLKIQSELKREEYSINVAEMLYRHHYHSSPTKGYPHAKTIFNPYSDRVLRPGTGRFSAVECIRLCNCTGYSCAYNRHPYQRLNGRGS